MHTKSVCCLREVTGIEKSLIQQIFVKVKDNYIEDIDNRTTNSINDTVAYIFTYLQDNYRQLMKHKFLECKYTAKKKIYHPCQPIMSIFSVVKELLEFSNITDTSYNQHQAINIAYAIIHRTGKFSLAVR